jgi:aquaporin Z
MTFMFLLVILGSLDKRVPAGFAPIPIVIHLISIPVTNTTVNAARSTGPAIFVGGWAMEQLWLFWVAPIVGAILAGLVYRWLWAEEPQVAVAPAPALSRRAPSLNVINLNRGTAFSV